MSEHSLSAEPIHSRWNADLPPRLTIDPGDTVHFECQDSSGAQVHLGMLLDEFTKINRDRIHALTGPVAIHGAMPGDVLEIEVLEVKHKGWGWSSVIPGLGFLKERFRDPFFFMWQLDEHTSHSLAPAVIPLRPFCGIMGVAPAEQGEFRTRVPGVFGGNLDVRELCAGATLYLPVLQPGALFSCGDAHAAQGDGEVCINGIECPADVTLRFNLHKGRTIPGPMLETAPRVSEDDRGRWQIIESSADPLEAARNATSRMVDLISELWRMDPVHAYILCSAAMNLQFSQVVNEPVYTVSASLPKSILPERKLFG